MKATAEVALVRTTSFAGEQSEKINRMAYHSSIMMHTSFVGIKRFTVHTVKKQCQWARNNFNRIMRRL